MRHVRVIAPACLLLGLTLLGAPALAGSSRLLEQVHGQVNLEISPMDDLDQYGEDRWVNEPQRRPGEDRAFGDCEDYALTKMTRLAAQGVPASAMAIEAVFTETGEHHAVLVVQLKGKTMVLDNRMPSPVSKAALLQLGYRWGDNGAADWASIFADAPAKGPAQSGTASVSPATRR